MAKRPPSKSGSRKVTGAKAAGKDRRARLEEIKRQQRAAERRKTLLAIVAGLVVGGLLIAIPVVSSVANAAEKKRKAAVGYVTTPSSDAKAAGCTGVRNDKVSRAGDHSDAKVNYDQVPPSSGKHNPDPLPDSIHFYAMSEHPGIERAVHLLEHGFVIGWYDAQLPADQVAKLKAASEGAGQRFVAVPWDREAFAGNQHLVLTAWGRSQRCTTVSPKVISSFVDKYVNVTAPEPGGGGGSLPSSPPVVPPSAGPTPTGSPSKK